MTLLLFSNGLTSIRCVSISSSSSSSSSNVSPSMAVTAAPISRFSLKPTKLPPKSSVGLHVLPLIAANKRGALSFKASSDTPVGGDSETESDDDDVPMHELPLDAKLLNKLEKKLKMKITKKIRLRRKKLVHKRRLRKKGRWPPSKMKRLSNI